MCSANSSTNRLPCLKDSDNQEIELASDIGRHKTLKVAHVSARRQHTVIAVYHSPQIHAVGGMLTQYDILNPTNRPNQIKHYIYKKGVVSLVEAHSRPRRVGGA